MKLMQHIRGEGFSDMKTADVGELVASHPAMTNFKSFWTTRMTDDWDGKHKAPALVHLKEIC